MAKSQKSIDLMVQSIRQSLDKIRATGDKIAFISWQEEVGFCGYLIHVDGRMMPMEGYQYGFNHINQLLNPQLSENEQKYARAEAGMIASSVESIADHEDIYTYIEDCATSSFGMGQHQVELAIALSKLSCEMLFELYFQVPRNSILFEDRKDRKNGFVVLSKDLYASTVQTDEADRLSWVSTLVARDGDRLAAGPLFANNVTQVVVYGGCIVVDESQYSHYSPPSLLPFDRRD